MNRDFANFIAARLFGAAQFKDGAHFARREAKLPRPLYKAQGPDMLVGKDPVAAFCSIGLGEQANFFEVANCLDMHACAAGEFAYRKTAHA